MANVIIKNGQADAANMDGRSMSTGEVRPVVVLGDPSSTNVVTVDSSGRIVVTQPTTTLGTVNSAATTNATSVKSSAGSLYSLNASNAGAAAVFVKLYNKASAPTVGTDVPVLTIAIPAGGTYSANFGALGQRFTTGIALAITNLVADSDTTVVAANQVKVLMAYI